MRKEFVTVASIVLVVFPTLASALTLHDLELQLRFVGNQLKTLYSQDGALAVAAAGSVNSAPECPILTRELANGDSDATAGGEVSVLQSFLVRKGEISNKAFAEMPKGYFGHLTQIALESWQTRHNLLATGKTDAVTRTSIVACRDTVIPAPVITLGTDKEYAVMGDEVTLGWNTQNATQCSLETLPDGGKPVSRTVGLNDTMSWSPSVSATITLVCTNNVGLETNGPESKQSIRVLVNEPLTETELGNIAQVSAALAALESALLSILGR